MKDKYIHGSAQDPIYFADANISSIQPVFQNVPISQETEQMRKNLGLLQPTGHIFL